MRKERNKNCKKNKIKKKKKKELDSVEDYVCGFLIRKIKHTFQKELFFSNSLIFNINLFFIFIKS
jgi:hypothetical protein